MSDALTSRPNSSGQILVITGLMLVVLIGFTALAIDVGMGLLAERWQRSVADAAALAGGQSLQKPNSRDLPGAAEQQEARDNAMHVLQEQLGGTPGAGDCFRPRLADRHPGWHCHSVP